MKVDKKMIESLNALRDLEKRNKELDASYIDMIIRIMHRKTKKGYKTILDAPCRTALMHHFLKEIGYEVFGVEYRKNLSEELIKKDPEHYFFQDLRRLKLNKNFDVILNFYTSLGTFDKKDDLKILRNFYEHLNHNGLLILETRHENKINISPKIKKINDIVIVIAEELAKNNKIKVITRGYKMIDDNLYFLARVENEVKLYAIHEIEEMIKSVGFEIEYIFDDLSIVNVVDNNPSSERIVIVAKKI